MKSRFAALVALVLLAACNFPTPTADLPTETIEAALVEPTDEPSPIPASPEPSEPPTAESVEGSPEPPERKPRIVGTSTGGILAIEPGTDPRWLIRVDEVSDVRISDDGEWVAYTIRDPDEDTAELHGIRFDGSDSQILMSAADFDALYPLDSFIHYTLANLDFLPGTHTLLFNTRGVSEGPGLAKSDDLLAIDVASGHLTPLLPRGQGGDFTPSHSGERIAIVRPGSLGFVDSDGGGQRQEVLTFAPAITYSEYFFYPIPVWSGDAVVLPVPQEDPFFAAEPGTVWSVDGEASVLANPEGDLFTPQGALPIVSPDGMHLAYLRSGEEAGEQHLVIQLLTTGEQITYDTGSIQWKGWAPDSYHFAYSKGSGLDLYIGDLLGEPVALGSGTAVGWINDSEFLYLAGVPWNWTLAKSDVSGEYNPLVGLNGQFVSYDFAE